MATGEDWLADGETVVAQLASGVLEYDGRARSGDPFRLPYPVNLQLALDGLTMVCWYHDVAPPTGIVDLLGWVEQSFDRWPVPLRGAAVDPDEALVEYGRPSQVCTELGVLRGDVEGEIRENRLIRAVMDKTQAAGAPESYVAFRRLLIEQPMITAQELDLALARPELARLSEELREAYVPTPPEAAADAVVRTCGGCGGLLLPLEDARTWHCEQPGCPEPGTSGPQYPVADGPMWLRRELRTFIVGPGRAELRIANDLGKRGLTVQLWPDFDKWDLAVFDQESWVVDVKAWRRPERLARHLRRCQLDRPIGAERAFIVIPDEQARGTQRYVERLRRDCPAVNSPGVALALSEKAFMRLVDERLRRTGATR